MSEPLAPGVAAPAFTLPDQDENPVRLTDLRGKPAILFFYPAALTPGCTREACDFQDSLIPLEQHGYQILGISRDQPEKLRRFREAHDLTYPLLSDPDHAVHAAYGAWGEKMNYGKVIEGVIRSTFVINEQGVITHALRNIRATGHVARLRKLLQVD